MTDEEDDDNGDENEGGLLPPPSDVELAAGVAPDGPAVQSGVGRRLDRAHL